MNFPQKILPEQPVRSGNYGIFPAVGISGERCSGSPETAGLVVVDHGVTIRFIALYIVSYSKLFAFNTQHIDTRCDDGLSPGSLAFGVPGRISPAFLHGGVTFSIKDVFR